MICHTWKGIHSMQDDSAASVTEIKTAQSQALSLVCQYVQENIIQQGCVERMTMLRERPPC